LAEEVVDTESFEHEISANLVGVLAEILSNITDEREVVRELLSNACAKEVEAKNVTVSVYESELGLAVSVKDDGKGMDYTQSKENPGRLDRFLNVAYSAQAGFDVDEFSYKGLGAKLLHNSRKAVVETSSGAPPAYRVEIEEPRKAIFGEKTVRKPSVMRIRETRPRGTNIQVLGWGDHAEITEEYRFDELKEYLRYFTVVGFTRNRPLPRVVLKVKGREEVLETGFPFIKPPREQNKRTFVLNPPLRFSEGGVTIEVTGGATVDTAENKLVERTGGAMVAWRGIPYFWIDGRSFQKILGIPGDFVRFVIDSDNIRLNTARSDLDYGDRSTDIFLDLVNRAAHQISEMPEFKAFYAAWNQDSAEKLAKYMEKAKAELKRARMVLLDGVPIHAEPRNETDVAAILWKLEGARALPFHEFRTLRYAGASKGIDLLVTIRETPEAERFETVFAEVENRFLSFYKHGHNLAQTRIVFCWEYDRAGFPDADVRLAAEGKQWKILVRVGEHQLTVYRISRFPRLSLEAEKDKTEAV